MPGDQAPPVTPGNRHPVEHPGLGRWPEDQVNGKGCRSQQERTPWQREAAMA